MKWYMKWIIYELRIWNQVKLWSSQLWEQFLQLRREAWKFRTSTGFEPVTSRFWCDAISNWAMKPTDVGSWSFVGSNGPVRNESMMKWYMKWIIYDLRIWNQVKLWSSQLWEQFCNCVEKPEKFIHDSFHVTFHHWFIPHGNIRTHKWPAPNVSGFIAQLVWASHRNREVTGSNSVEVLNFSDFYTQLQKLLW